MSPGVWHERNKFTFYRIRAAPGGGSDHNAPASPQVCVDRARRLVCVNGTVSSPLNLLDTPEVKDFHASGWLHFQNGMTFAATICKREVDASESPENLSRVFSFGNTKGGSPN